MMNLYFKLYEKYNFYLKIFCIFLQRYVVLPDQCRILTSIMNCSQEQTHCLDRHQPAKISKITENIHIQILNLMMLKCQFKYLLCLWVLKSLNIIKFTHKTKHICNHNQCMRLVFKFNANTYFWHIIYLR